MDVIVHEESRQFESTEMELFDDICAEFCHDDPQNVPLRSEDQWDQPPQQNVGFVSDSLQVQNLIEFACCLTKFLIQITAEIFS